MPSRKNRPDKHRSSEAPSIRPLRPLKAHEYKAAMYLLQRENMAPGTEHYTPYDLFDGAESLKRAGYINDPFALGCFHIVPERLVELRSRFKAKT